MEQFIHEIQQVAQTASEILDAGVGLDLLVSVRKNGIFTTLRTS